ncbi:hypothetical protein [Salinisphaera sp.]|uniref:hypothetical protein n=1 Tax=Salinisphaera sp. TaxID=1914330 RepID=UPI000C35CA4E|nr:hypothetical protein [Salinisphaera sp.]MAS09938.1 hypothetical protein [Salinisphaera sp.]|tara:strand:- start:8009 stop:8209 length:201 start_codon:yes stop_codon:yes gene_type:complete
MRHYKVRMTVPMTTDVHAPSAAVAREVAGERMMEEGKPGFIESVTRVRGESNDTNTAVTQRAVTSS